MAKEDFYDLLGVSKTATPDDLKKAYRKQAMKYHPDRNPGDKASEAKFKEVNEAYEVLSDPQKRRMYDQMGPDAFNQSGAGNASGGGGFYGGGFNFEDIFGGGVEDIFSSFFGGGSSRGGRRSGRPKGEDLLLRVSITLKDAFLGVSKMVSITREESCSVCNGVGAASKSDITTCKTCNGVGEVTMRQGVFAVRQTCPQCHGSGSIVKNPCRVCKGSGLQSQMKEVKVNIPPGVDTGIRLKLTGEGNSIQGGAKGDLFVEISVLKDSQFTRQDANLTYPVEVSFTTMVLGGEINITTLADKTLSVKIPTGTAAGQMLKIRGEGMPVLSSGGRRGDLFIIVQTHIPKTLSTRAKELIRELDRELK